MDGIRERLKAVLKRTGWSARRLAREAGLPSESHVSLIIRGTIGKGISVETVERIARAAAVDFRWLATGEGDPDAGEFSQNLRTAVDSQPGRWEKHLIQQAVLLRRMISEDPTPEQWVEYLDMLKRETRRVQLEINALRDVTVPQSSPSPIFQAQGTAPRSSGRK